MPLEGHLCLEGLAWGWGLQGLWGQGAGDHWGLPGTTLGLVGLLWVGRTQSGVAGRAWTEGVVDGAALQPHPVLSPLLGQDTPLPTPKNGRALGSSRCGAFIDSSGWEVWPAPFPGPAGRSPRGEGRGREVSIIYRGLWTRFSQGSWFGSVPHGPLGRRICCSVSSPSG